MPPQLAAVLEAVGFAPQGEGVGNLRIGRGAFEGRAVHVALVENRIASGSIGAREAERLAALLRVVQAEHAALVLFLDSAGARVSEALHALGAFRRLYRAALDAMLDDVPFAVVLGRNCFGGASMLAQLGHQRLFGPETRFAMSGPAVIAAAAGGDALDEAFRAMVDAAIAPEVRAGATRFNQVWSAQMDVAAWLREAFAARDDETANWMALRHDGLVARLPQRQAPAAEPVRRPDLERLFPGGYEARVREGVLQGQGRDRSGNAWMVGLVGPGAVRAAQAWELADFAWKLRHGEPTRLEVFLDCASHAPSLDDERAVQTEFIVDMALALRALALRGTRVGLTILGRAGGGVYVALAAPAERVRVVHDAQVEVLPGAAVAAILGESRESEGGFPEYRSTGVADEQLRLGLVPGA